MNKKELKRKMDDLKNCKDIQSQKGNYDQSEYMRGLANGLILAHSILEGIEPKYKEEHL